MMDSHVFSDFGVTGEIAGRQLDMRDAMRRATREHERGTADIYVRFLTIARDEGTMGNEVAQELAKRLKWQVFDKEIVSYIAKTRRVRESLVSQLDEKSQGLLQDLILSLLETPEFGSFGSVDYHRSLLQTLACLANHGSTILVGRGAGFALREYPGGLNVRITASLEVRLQRISQSLNMTREHARRYVQHTDEERRKFIHQYYRQDYEDMRFYDMVFNTDRALPEQIADTILAFMCARAGEPTTRH